VRDIIKKILQESEMTEMGMKIGKLKGIQPQNYLIKSLRAKEKTHKVKEKEWVLQLNNLYKEIVDSLKNLQWHEIKFTKHQEHFFILLPGYIKTKMKKLKNLYDRVEYGPYQHLIEPREKISRMERDYRTVIEDDNMNMYTETERHRTHFPEGLPYSLLGTNLGFKIYRKLVNDLRFIQSEDNASNDVQNIYRQLVEQSDLNCVMTKTSVLILRRDIPKEEKINIVSEYIYEKYHNSSSNRPLVVNRDLVLDGPLLRELGEKKVQRLSKELLDFSKKSIRQPFKEFPYEFETHDEN
jgi:hypothetical protein